MITASGSITFTHEATPAPRAFTARSISLVARSSPCFRARSQMPLVSRSLLCSSMILKRSVLAPFCDLLARLDLHRLAARVGLHAALAPAGAACAAHLHDHVPDLRRRPSAEPRLAVQDQAAADAGAPPDAQDGVELLGGAQLELGLDCDLDVVADPHRDPEVRGEALPEREGPDPVWEVPGVRDDARRLVRVARRAHADAAEVARLRRPACSAASRMAACISPRHVLRAALRGGGSPSLDRGPCCRRPRRRSGSWCRRGRSRRAVRRLSRDSRSAR